MTVFPEATANKVNVAKFIRENYTPYESEDLSFLAPATERTTTMWNHCIKLIVEEAKKGVLDVDAKTPSTIVSHKAGYIDQENEVVVGLQTDAPLKRAIKPYGGWRIVKNALESYGFEMDPEVMEVFSKYRTTHNDGVFAMYTAEMRKCRTVGIITGLPDGYGRGRIIGDYRRIALFGIDKLIALKTEDKDLIDFEDMTEEAMRARFEITQQINALKQIKTMGSFYGCELGRPAESFKEAVQWTYMGYLAAVKEQDGAAMSFGRIDAFLDIYAEKDLAAGVTESEIQEIIDDFIIKLRIVRHLRTPEYNDLFAGDPAWITLVLGGMTEDRRPLVTKTSYRLLHSLYNLGPAPEPNMTILWADKLPKAFKDFTAKVSIDTSSIQYENDDLMRPMYGDDYAIACCVSAMRVGKDMQFFGARCNMAKLLLYSFNHGVDEVKGVQVSPDFGGLEGDVLEFDDVWARYDKYMDWMATLYCKTMNVIHYSHDQFCYEAAQMALHDSNVRRFIAFGIAGLSVVADSLSAIKYAKVTAIRNEEGLVTDFKTEGDFPCYGNNDERVDAIAAELISVFMEKLRSHKTYRDSIHTLSILTITSNVVYGRKTGSTPDGRKLGEPFAPGANPMHGRDNTGAVNCLSSVAKMPYRDSMDGISLTFSIVPPALGKTDDSRVDTLRTLLDGYFAETGHHINVNVLNRETLIDATAHPEKYPQLTIRVSGYAIQWIKLTDAQRAEVIARTFHESI